MAMMRCMNCMEEYNEKQNKCPHCGYMNIQPVKADRHLLQETSLQRRYIVGNVLRENEHEIIYIGWDSALDKRVAIKEYFPVDCVKRVTGQKELSYKSQESKAQFMCGLEQFVSEAQQLARFREETGMIRIYDNFEENGTAYTIIEYAESLRETIAIKTPKVVDKWRRTKKVFYTGWGFCVVAIIVLLILIFGEMHMKSIFVDYDTIPHVVGMTYQQAEKVLESFGVKIEREKYCYSDTVDVDIITCQSVPEGTKLEKGMVVKVVVTSEKKEETTKGDSTENKTEELTTTEVSTTEVTTTEASTAPASTERTTQQTAQSTTKATTKEKNTQKKTEKKTTEKKTEKKTEQEKTTEKTTTEEEVIVIED